MAAATPSAAPANRLAHSTSPYLQQHAANPVDWHEWNAEALQLARESDRPILLSIGYAACHWCHVMAHESFEDAATAAVMNRLYVNIKVDREQRPDLDRVYQLSHQLLTQRGGGWPLTVFLDPQDLTAYFAGTYFPKERRYGMPAFVEVLEGARQWYDRERPELRAQNQRLRTVLDEVYRGPAPRAPTDLRALDTALRAWQQNLDPRHGGLGGGPHKFPHGVELARMAEHALAPDSPLDGLRERLLQTLEAMAQGGLYDHLGGGFYRYCVDPGWEIPHFEKMLYDNALLLPLYARAAAQLGRSDFAAVASGTLRFLQRELGHADGAFCSSLDADSEGHEGRFYVWTREQVAAVLPDPADQALAFAAFGLDRPPNFEGEAWHLTRRVPLAELAALLELAPEQAAGRLDDITRLLFEARAPRVRPGLDDKWLTGWNALLIAGLAEAGRWLQREDWSELALRTYEELRARLRQDDPAPAAAGRWFACWRGGRAELGPYLDDHAYLLAAQLELLAAGGTPQLLADAVATADTLLRDFADSAAGGFHFTAHDAEALPARPKGYTDEATPNGNGVAAQALLRLGRLLGEPRYLEAAEATLRAGGGELQRHPDACASLLGALQEAQAPPLELVWRGPATELRHWQGALRQAERAGWLVYRLPDVLDDNAAQAWSGALASMPGSPQGRAYLCRAGQCELPLATPDDLSTRVSEGRDDLESTADGAPAPSS